MHLFSRSEKSKTKNFTFVDYKHWKQEGKYCDNLVFVTIYY